MAFPLPSAIATHKLALNVRVPSSTRRQILKPTHFIFCFNSKIPERSARFRIPCLSIKDVSKELADQPDIPISLNMPTKRHKKKLERLIAVILLFIQFSCPIPFVGWDSWSISPGKAVLYSPDTKVPRTGELALRRAIPANTNMKAIQDSLEEISYLLRIPQRKPYGTMEGNVKRALKIATDEKDSILASVPTNLKEKGSTLHASLIDGKGGLRALLDSINEKDPDKVSVGLASSLDTVAELELLQAPGLSFLLPEQYLKYPRLTGRGIVEFTIEKGDGSTFSPEAGGEARKTATIQIVIDGYSAPLTAGNFAKLVIDGAYNGARLYFTDQAILSDKGLDKNSGYSVPLEIKPSGQFEPLYRTTLSVQDGELPVLPLSVYGAVAMAHSETSEEYSSPYQFFFYLYDKRNIHNYWERNSSADKDRGCDSICKASGRSRSPHIAK
ncbi:peptidyl-prolyl cis-trans isomerase CYP37, chloroplastic isoform X2 [Ziziphus jujuba]|uniref:Peptidyl-prolyl cis-trans isomerase CYP37, chloroplastic isoform X2 n=1 Tax=Ziziphus jujuba TaxID=326968 RepID=A0ABM3IFB4_ZIZJJ|nr:peptidyl-prolyl cis-trans isomerase CYP37, chloroplastic isoform X2 [Ziziphus jujuba]